MSGAELQANAIDSGRELAPLESASGVWTVVFIVLFALLPPLAALRLRPIPLLATGIAVMALYLLIAQYGFHHGVVLPVMYPMIALAVSLFGTVLIESLAASISERGRRAIA